MMDVCQSCGGHRKCMPYFTIELPASLCCLVAWLLATTSNDVFLIRTKPFLLLCLVYLQGRTKYVRVQRVIMEASYPVKAKFDELDQQHERETVTLGLEPAHSSNILRPPISEDCAIFPPVHICPTKIALLSRAF